VIQPATTTAADPAEDTDADGDQIDAALAAHLAGGRRRDDTVVRGGLTTS
jgi:hypothetical protein